MSEGREVSGVEVLEVETRRNSRRRGREAFVVVDVGKGWIREEGEEFEA